jgi:hypothetical protein
LFWREKWYVHETPYSTVGAQIVVYPSSMYHL